MKRTNLRHLPSMASSQRALQAVAALLVMAIPPSTAAGAPGLCLAPALPMIDLPSSMIIEYRTEIAAEFEEYFREISIYLACLDGERLRAFAEAQQAADTYHSFVTSSRTEKDMP